ncbi:MAG: hypothetical protein M1837_007194 [Sclerophora amabilis]|nr:MAG: hypothetical protein M1837_007194 [Sclerophora amabilis]
MSRKRKASLLLEDENNTVNAEDATASQRATPRNAAGDRNGEYAAGETPFSTLRQLAGLIRKPTTPLRRASSVGAMSGKWLGQRTPSERAQTPGTTGPLRPKVTGRGAPTTPHALRALQQRRAGALTPRRDRRRSGRMQRETPRDTLRALSKILAAETQPTDPSPQVSLESSRAHDSTTDDEDEWEEEPGLPAPRLSLPLNNEDDSDELDPPALSEGVEEEDLTLKSVELPRRAASELPQARFSRASFGGTRYSDRFADLNELGLDFAAENEEDDEDDVRPTFDDLVDLDGGEGISDMIDETVTRDLRQDFAAAHSQRLSDIRPTELPNDGDETTFQLQFPQREMRAASSESEDGVYEAEGDQEAHDAEDHDAHVESAPTVKPVRPRAGKELKMSRHGIPYPSLPTSVVKKMATKYARSSGNGKSRINRETLAAIMHATDLFFEQLSDDLGAYARHARRKTIDESDMITLMKRQRQINATKTPFSLAQRHLPRELLQDVRMAPPPKLRKTSKRRLNTVMEETEDDE